MPESKTCVTCGTEYPQGYAPEICSICNEERQYVPLDGQKWTVHKKLSDTHKTAIKKVKTGLYELYLRPKFAIGQRAFLVLSKNGNVLWDCIPLLDNETKAFIHQKGGLKAIAFSHPHYYSNMNTWAQEFGCPILIHQKDKPYIVNPSKAIRLWKGQTKTLRDDLRLIHLGGHFDGAAVLLLQNQTAEGLLLCSDILQISRDRKFVAMMYSYPNNIPLPLREIRRMEARLKDIPFDTLLGAFRHQFIEKEAKSIVDRSIERYFA